NVKNGGSGKVSTSCSCLKLKELTVWEKIHIKNKNKKGKLMNFEIPVDSDWIRRFIGPSTERRSSSSDRCNISRQENLFCCFCATFMCFCLTHEFIHVLVILKLMSLPRFIFIGDPRDVELQEKRVYEIAAQFGGIPAGETNGERGYTLTFVIAYISKSFETSVSWDRTLSLCRNVKHRLANECKAAGITKYLISCRVTQTYDVGSCVYFIWLQMEWCWRSSLHL
ncbi:hypothetical protein L9F63_026967, partial [Diploptera punctata]